MAYTTADGGYGASGSVLHFTATHSDTIVIPDAELLFTGDFKRHGPDLILTGHDGRHHVVPGYFSSEKHPALVAPNGAGLSAALVDLLAGSPTPGQFAQASSTPTDPIGKVEKVVGHVVVIRNGVAVALNVGDAVYKSDVIQTGANSSCGLDFPDGTALNLVANTRMALNDYSFDPNSNSNDALFSLVQGTFAFVAGKVAHTGDMKIETPVATMGIRGTTGFVQEQIGTISANIGSVTYSFAVVEDYGTGRVGQYELIDSQGNVVALVSQNGFLTYVTPQGTNLPPIVTTQPMSNTQLGFQQQIIQQVFQVLNSATNPNPQSNPGSNGSSTPPSPFHNLPQLLQNNGNGTTFTVGGNGAGNQSNSSNTQNSHTTVATPIVTWVGSFGGDWNNPYNWSDGIVPLAWEVVDLNTKATLSGGATVAGLVITSSGILNIAGGGDLTLSNSLEIAQGGALQLNSSGVDPTLAISGAVSMTGGGTVYLLGTGGNNIIAASHGAILTNFADTIAGSGTIGAGDQTLTLINGVDPVKGTHGTIDATPLLPTDSGILTIHTGNLIDNSGVMEATAGGTLKIADDLDNSGGIASFGGTVSSPIASTVSFESVTVTNESGGVIGTQGAGASITFTDGIVVNDGVIATNGGAVTFTDSTVTNNTLVDLASGSPGINADGGGTITFDGGSATNNGLMAAHDGSQIVFQNGQADNTIGSAALLQAGFVEGIAAFDGGTVTFSGEQVTNTGLIAATVGSAHTGGTVNFDNTIVDNSGGFVAAINPGATNASVLVNLSDSTIEGGTVATSGQGSSGTNIDIVVSATGANDPNLSTLDGTTEGPLTVAGYVGIFQGAQLELKGTIHIDSANGEIDVGGPSGGATGPANLVIGGTVALDTDGENTTSATISLDGTATHTAQIVAAAGGGTLDNVNTLIAGSGNIGAGNPDFLLINETSGVINASGTTALTIDNDSPATNNFALNEIINSGTIEATGTGGLTIENSTIDNSTFDPSSNSGVDGHIAVASGSMIGLDSATILQGFVSTALGGKIETVAGSSNEIETANGPSHNANVATIVNQGTLAVSDDSSLTLASPGPIENTGKIELNAAGNAASDATTLYLDQGFAGINGGGQITLSDSTENFISVTTSGDQLTNFDNTISGAGTIGGGGMVLVNDATIDATGTDPLVIDAAGTPSVQGQASLTNTGTLEATGGATLAIASPTVNNASGIISAVGAHSVVQLSGAAVTGGTISGAGTLEITASSSIAGVSQGDFTVAGVTVDTGQTLTLENDSISGTIFTDTASGAILSIDAGTVTLTDVVIDGGTIEVASGAILNLVDSEIDNASLKLDLHGALNVIGTSTINTFQSTLSGDTTVESGQTLVLHDELVIGAISDDGTVEVSGTTTTLHGGSIVEISGSHIQIDSAQHFTLESGAEISGGPIVNGGTLEVVDNATVSGALISGGIVQIDGNATLTLEGSAINGSTVNDYTTASGNIVAGDIQTSGASEIENGSLNNGNVTVESGTLTIDAETVAGTSVTIVGGNIALGDTVKLEGGASLNDGSVTNDGTLEVVDAATVSGATISGGIVQIDGNATLTLGSIINGSTVNDYDTSGVGRIDVTGTSEIENAAVTGGNLVADAALTLSHVTLDDMMVSGSATVTNADTLTIAGTLTLDGATVSGGFIDDYTTNASGTVIPSEIDVTGVSEIENATVIGGNLVADAALTLSHVTLDDMMVSGSATVTNADTLTIAGTLTLDGATVSGGFIDDYTTNASGTVIPSEIDVTGVSEIENATVIGGNLVADAALTLSHVTLDDMMVSGSATVTNADTLTIAGTLTLDGATVSGGFIDDYTTNASGTVIPSEIDVTAASEIENATVTGGNLVADAALTLSHVTLDDMTLSGSATVTNADTLTIAGTLTLDGATVSGGFIDDYTTNASGTVIPSEIDVTGVSEIENATVIGGNLVADAALTLSHVTLDDMTLSGSATVTNTDTLTIGIDGVTLDGATVSGGTIDDYTTNASGTVIPGEIDVTAASEIDNATVTGGTITVDPGQTLTLNNDTLDTLTLSGNFTNSDTLTIDDTVMLNGATITGGTIDNDGTISGHGQIGDGTVGNTILDNTSGAIIEATGLLELITGNPITNAGTLEADGAKLGIGTDVKNSGEILATGGGTIQVNGGAISWDGTATPVAGTNGIVLAGATDSLVIDDGTLLLNGTGTGSGAVSLAGGTIRGFQTSAETLENVNNTISGYGHIGVGTDGLTLTNEQHATIDATGTSPLVINTGANTITNAGALEASDLSTLHIESAVTNSGTVNIDDGGTVELDGITITNTNTIEVNAATGSGVSLSPTYLEIAGTVTLQGGPGNATGTGTVTLTDSYNNFIDSNGSAAELINADNTISGAGTIGDANLTLDNETYGVIDATGTNPLILNTGTNQITNAGTLEATNGGQLTVQSGVDNAGGNVDAAGGFIDFWMGISGGHATISDGGKLEYGWSSNVNTAFDGTGTLVLDHQSQSDSNFSTAQFTGTVSGFGSGDTIDLTGVNYTSSEYDVWTQGTGIHAANGSDPSGTLTVYSGNTLEASLSLGGSYAQTDFALTGDSASGTPGTDIVWSPASGSISGADNIGNAVNGYTVTANLADANASNITYTWLENGQVVSGQTADTFTPGAGDTGKTLDVVVGFSNGNTAEQITELAGTVAAAPAVSFTAAGPDSTNENAALAVTNGFTVTFSDAGSDSMTATISVTNGMLTIANEYGIGSTNDADSITLTGTLSTIENALGSGVTYTPNNGFAGADALSFSAADGAFASNTALLNIDVIAVPPLFTSGATSNVNEGVPAQTTVYTAAATVPAGDAVTYLLVSGQDASDFAINATSGAVTIDAVPSYETQNSYSFTVEATDQWGVSTTKAVTLSVNDLPPVISSGNSANVNEGVPANSTVYTAVAAEPGGGTVAYSLTGTDASDFTINSSTGVVTINAVPSYETQSSYNFTVEASNAAGQHNTEAVTLSVHDLPPVISSGNSANVNEGVPANSTVYTAVAAEPGGGPVTYSLVGGLSDNASDFTINATTGVVTINAVPSYETQSSYNFTVEASNAAGQHNTEAVTLSVHDLPPVISSGNSANVNEGVPANSTVYTAVAAEPGGGPVTYSLVGGLSDNASDFTINATTGVVTINAVPSYETQSSYNFTVEASNAAGQHNTEAVTLSVHDLPPVISSGNSANVNEGVPANSTVYTAVAAEPGGGPVTYSLVGGLSDNASDFTINATTGVVTINAVPSYETQSSYNFTVEASNAAGQHNTEAVTLGVTAAAPTVTTPTISDETSGSNTVTQGDTLAAAATGNGFADDTIGYGWYSSASNYQTEVGTGSTYVVKADDIGDTLEVVATSTNGAGASVSATSAPTATVIAPIDDWTNAAGGDWSTGSDWDHQSPPAASAAANIDSAIVEAQASYFISVSADTSAGKLTLNDADATLDVGNGNTPVSFTLGGSATVDNGEVDVINDTTMTVGGTLTLEGGTFFAGSTNNPGGVLTVDGAVIVDGGQLSAYGMLNAASIEVEGNGDVELDGDATVTGAVDVDGGSFRLGTGASLTAASFTVAGGFANIGIGEFDVSGPITLNGGQLTISNLTTFMGTDEVTFGANGGTLTYTGSSTIAGTMPTIAGFGPGDFIYLPNVPYETTGQGPFFSSGTLFFNNNQNSIVFAGSGYVAADFSVISNGIELNNSTQDGTEIVWGLNPTLTLSLQGSTANGPYYDDYNGLIVEQVVVKDGAGNLINGVSVQATLSVISGGENGAAQAYFNGIENGLSTTTSFNDGTNGIAFLNFNTDGIAGTYNIAVTLDGVETVSQQFTVQTTQAWQPHSSLHSVLEFAGPQETALLTLTDLDIANNPRPGDAVTWSTTGGGTFSPANNAANDVTDANGTLVDTFTPTTTTAQTLSANFDTADVSGGVTESSTVNFVTLDTWENSAGGIWDSAANATNWSTAGLPTSGEGVWIGAAGTYTVHLTTPETIDGLGTISTATLDLSSTLDINGQAIDVLAGAVDLESSGALVAQGDATVELNGSLSSSAGGNLTADGATIDVNAALSGTLAITIENAGIVNVAQALGTSDTVTFAGDGTLVLGAAPAAGMTVSDFGLGDTIDLSNFASTNASLSWNAATNTLTMSNGSASESLHFDEPNGLSDVAHFALTADGSGGTDIVYNAPSLATLATVSGTDGGAVSAGLITDARGDLLGTTAEGGTNNSGTVFEIKNDGSVSDPSYASSPTILVNFNSGTGSFFPVDAVMIDGNGNLFATAEGNSESFFSPDFNGTVFEIVNTGSSASSPVYASSATTLIAFSTTNNASQGGGPEGSLIEDAHGDLFGTTSYGGPNSGFGTVFELVYSGGNYSLTTLATFNGAGGYNNPESGLLMDSNGDLFGTTSGMGSNGPIQGFYGYMFEIANTGSTSSPSYASGVTTSLEFDSYNGANPIGGLVEDAKGDLFGTTAYGGANGNGTIFEIVNNGTVAAPSYSGIGDLFSFSSAGPRAGLIIDGNGDLFGITSIGEVFELANVGTVAAPSYASDLIWLGTPGTVPAGDYAPLYADGNGNLFGTATDPNNSADGVVFEITNSGYIVHDPATIATGGSFEIAAASNDAITFAGNTGLLQLDQSQGFVGTVANFSGQDQIDLRDIGFGANTTLSYGGNSGNTLGVLTVTDGTHTANIELLGQYVTGNFTMASDGHGGTIIVDPPVSYTVANGASQEIAGQSNANVTFAGSTGSLVLDNPASFTGHIDGFTGTAPDAQHSDVIDLAGINHNSGSFTESYNSTTGVLTVSDGTNSANLTFDNFNGTFKFASDGNGGTDIFDPPATNSPSGVSVGHDSFVFHSSLADAGHASPDSNGAHDHAAWAHSEEWSALAAATQEAETVDIAQPAESHWHHALHNATHLH